MTKKNLQLIPSLILYIIAFLLMIYAIWGLKYSADIISQARAAGQLAGNGIEFDIASFYMGTSGQYVIFAILIAATGLILQRKQSVTTDVAKLADDVTNKANDEELDDWFSEEGEN